VKVGVDEVAHVDVDAPVGFTEDIAGGLFFGVDGRGDGGRRVRISRERETNDVFVGR
jgi:hypothetical protein